MRFPAKLGVFISTPSLEAHILAKKDQEDLELMISHQLLDDALPVAQEMVKNGAEAILSRRGTSQLLRNQIDIPILTFPTLTTNIISSVSMAPTNHGKILLTSPIRPFANLGLIRKLLSVELIQCVYHDTKSLRDMLLKYSEQGCRIAVGGMVTQRFAREAGLEFFELLSSEEEITDTFESAIAVVLSAREKKMKALLYKTIIDATSDAIIAVDANLNIMVANSFAGTLFHYKTDSLIGLEITRLLPQLKVSTLDENLLQNEIVKINNIFCLVNQHVIRESPLSVGFVFSFRTVSKLMKEEYSVRRNLSKGFVARYKVKDIVHQGQSMKSIINRVKEFATTDSTILVMGETGSGKELVAQSIHTLSYRKHQPFVSVNCSSLPESLLESELFGYEEGAFTGSKKGGKPGLFELAHKGAIFLDEIDAANAKVQKQLLRVLQEKEVMRIGGSQKIPIDVRIITAAGRNLWKVVQEGDFRKDLYFRLDVLTITIPPLRERKEDIPVLFNHFLSQYTHDSKIIGLKLEPFIINSLMNYDWPGNIRQLEHFVEKLILNLKFRDQSQVLPQLIQELFNIAEDPVTPENAHKNPTDPFSSIDSKSTPTFFSKETSRIMSALQEAKFNKNRAAEILGVSRTTLWRKIRLLNIDA